MLFKKKTIALKIQNKKQEKLNIIIIKKIEFHLQLRVVPQKGLLHVR